MVVIDQCILLCICMDLKSTVEQFDLIHLLPVPCVQVDLAQFAELLQNPILIIWMSFYLYVKMECMQSVCIA